MSCHLAVEEQSQHLSSGVPDSRVGSRDMRPGFALFYCWPWCVWEKPLFSLLLKWSGSLLLLCSMVFTGQYQARLVISSYLYLNRQLLALHWVPREESGMNFCPVQPPWQPCSFLQHICLGGGRRKMVFSLEYSMTMDKKCCQLPSCTFLLFLLFLDWRELPL